MDITYLEILINLFFGKCSWFRIICFANCNKSLSDGLAYVVKNMFPIFAKVKTLTTMASGRIVDDRIVKHNIEISH